MLSTAAQDTYNKAAHPQAATSVTTTTANEFSISLPAQSVAMVVPAPSRLRPPDRHGPSRPSSPETGWTFDKDMEGWKMDLQTPATLGATTVWNSTEGKPQAGSLAIQTPFTGRKQQAQSS